MSNYIDINSLTKTFNNFTAVDNISLVVQKGQVLGFIGPNGAGKTTTMRMITGYLHPTSGSVSIMNENVELFPVLAKKYIGYLPEGGPLYSDLSPRIFLNFIGKARNLSPQFLQERIDFVVDKLDLSQVFDQAIETLSKGFKRRVGLAQAILHDPNILILDEPTDGLDPIQKVEVRNLIKAMAKDKAIIISTHILEEVQAICDRVVIINQGKIVIDSTAEKLIKNHPSYNTVILTLRKSPYKKILNTIEALANVRKVQYQEMPNNLIQFTIYPAKSANILHKVSLLANDNGWNIESLEVMQGNLDEVFLEYCNN